MIALAILAVIVILVAIVLGIALLCVVCTCTKNSKEQYNVDHANFPVSHTVIPPGRNDGQAPSSHNTKLDQQGSNEPDASEAAAMISNNCDDVSDCLKAWDDALSFVIYKVDTLDDETISELGKLRNFMVKIRRSKNPGRIESDGPEDDDEIFEEMFPKVADILKNSNKKKKDR